MKISATTASILLAFGASYLGWAQNIPVQAPEVFAAENFFARVQVSVAMRSQLSRNEPVFLNGQEISAGHPALRNVIDLTDQESRALLDIVADYRAKKSAYYESMSPLRREALYQSIESGKVAPALAQRIQELQDRQTKMVFDQMERVKTTLGDVRFRAIEAAANRK